MDNKSCENCHYFSKHYRFNGARFVYANCGLCTNLDIHFSKRRKKREFTACDMWVPTENTTKEKRANFKQQKINVTQKWNDILDLLNSDFFD